MQIILIKDLDTLGQKNELVNVRPGYARNYLIPNKTEDFRFSGDGLCGCPNDKNINKNKNAL